MGSVTLTIAAMATAASAAFPPDLIISAPNAAARGWLEHARPFFAKTGARKELNGSIMAFKPHRRPRGIAVYFVMNTSLRGNFSKTAGSCEKFVARMSTGLPAIHCDRLIV